MTPKQIELARHALGLPNERHRSYRNYYTCSPGTSANAEWCKMVELGDAIGESKRWGSGGNDIFWLTEKGARKALKPNERLDLEDWPERLRAARSVQ